MVNLTDLPEELIVEICRQICFGRATWKRLIDRRGLLSQVGQRKEKNAVANLAATCKLLHRVAIPELRRHILVTDYAGPSSALQLAKLLDCVAADPVAFAPSVKLAVLEFDWNYGRQFEEVGDVGRLRLATKRARQAGQIVMSDVDYRASQHDPCYFHIDKLAVAFLSQLKHLKELKLESDGYVLVDMALYIQTYYQSFLPSLESLTLSGRQGMFEARGSCIAASIAHFGERLKAVEICRIPIDNVSGSTFKNLTSVKLMDASIQLESLRPLLSECRLEEFVFCRALNHGFSASDVIDALTPSADTLRSLFLTLGDYWAQPEFPSSCIGQQHPFSMDHFKTLENFRIDDWRVARRARHTAGAPPTDIVDATNSTNLTTYAVLPSNLPESLKRFHLYRFIPTTSPNSTLSAGALALLDVIADECSRGRRKCLKEVAFQPVGEETKEIYEKLEAAGVDVLRMPATGPWNWHYI
ncbi:hypothetical protein K456DRAFT_1726151 [Colletotrichum gloeosporioides 23]|nr:hypothetical protein K456DRAFT_1726151 [Colletotrichum gloeosporioides 23]